MKLIHPLQLFTLALALSGCDAAVKNYVRDAKPPSTAPRAPASDAPSGPQQITVSGGSVDAGTTGLRLKARLGTNEQTFQMGGDRKATLSIGRTRVE